MPKVMLFPCLCLSLLGCSDTIRVLQKADSPNGDVSAEYVEILYGGAAGGVTYCVNLRYGSRVDECALAAIHVKKADLEWNDRQLTFHYCGGTLTNDESGTKTADGVTPFQLIIDKCLDERS